ncbi:MAG: toxin-antitoxin system HicB family antitoxin [Spirochaetota bacterium]
MGKTDLAEQIGLLLKRPYRREYVPTEEGTWIGSAPELSGCVTEADTQAEAVELLDDAMRAWFETAIHLGRPIPEPLNRPARRFSGKFNLRVPVRLHRALSEQAVENGSSLNEYCVFLLAEGTGQQASFDGMHRMALQQIVSDSLMRHTGRIMARSTWPSQPQEEGSSQEWVLARTEIPFPRARAR